MGHFRFVDYGLGGKLCPSVVLHEVNKAARPSLEDRAVAGHGLGPRSPAWNGAGPQIRWNAGSEGVLFQGGIRARSDR